MAETSMSLDELVRKLMGDDHADVLLTGPHSSVHLLC